MRHLLLSTFFIIAFSVYAGQPEFDYSVKKEISGNYSITIKIIKGTSGYIFFLLDKEPWNGGKVIKKEGPISESTFVFYDLKPGNYLVGVEDKTQSNSSQKVTIKD